MANRWTRNGRRNGHAGADTRVVYGARCLWWDSIGSVSATASGLPCCPHCGGVLMEVSNEKEWWGNVRKHEDTGNPGYEDFIRWLRGRCFATLASAQEAYAAQPEGGAR